MPVPVFCCFFIPEKLVWKYSRNWTKIYGGPYFIRRHLESEGETKWSHEGSTRGLGAAKGGAAPYPCVSPSGVSSRRPFAYLFPRCETPKYPSHSPRKVSEAPPSSTLAREGPEPLPGTLPERAIVTGGFYIAMHASGVMRE